MGLERVRLEILASGKFLAPRRDSEAEQVPSTAPKLIQLIAMNANIKNASLPH